MMKTCQNCHTENPVDAVFCSSCGMSLLERAATGKESEVQDTMDPAAKRLRRIARLLAVIWAVCWTVASAAALLAGAYLCLNEGPESEYVLCVVWVLMLLIVGFIFLLTWVPTAIAWRWETIGGVMLVVIGLLSGAPNLLNSIWTPVFPVLPPLLSAFAVLFFSGPPLAAGLLLLASWRRSRTTAGLPFLADRRKWYAAIAAVAMLSLVILCLVARFLALRDVSPFGSLLVIDPSPSISAEGRYVAFASLATDLVPGDSNELCDVFVHDQQTGDTFLVSVASNGTQGNGDSNRPSISADGRYVAFESWASNLVPGDTNHNYDVFVHDRQTGQTERVSVASDGTQGNGFCTSPSISADGRHVAFTSEASNLVAADTNDAGDVFVHDRQTGQTERVSVASDGTQGNGFCASPSISADGRYTAFRPEASNLVRGDANDIEDIFVHDRQTGQTVRISVASQGSQTD